MESNYSSNDIIKAKIAHGNYTCVYKYNIVGVCTYPAHRGMVTKSVLKSHKCQMKKCRYFKKTNVKYWKLREPKKDPSKIPGPHKTLPDNYLFVQDVAKKLGYYIEVLAITELIDKYVIIYKNKFGNLKCDLTVLCYEISIIWDKDIELKEFVSELELSQLIADSLGYKMTFTRHTIDTQKKHITLYYYSNKEFDSLNELNVKLSQQLRLTVSFLADMDYILSYAQDLCQRKEIGIEIVDYSYEPETRKCVLSYVPNMDINNFNEITGIIGRTYHCVAKLCPIEELVTV